MEMMNTQGVQSELAVLNMAKETLPVPYRQIDDGFLGEFSSAIESLKKLYESRGGIHLIGPDEEMMTICRVPSREHINEWQKRAEKLKDPMDRDMDLVQRCLIYPDREVVLGWAKQAPGVVTNIGLGILAAAKMNREPIVKKL